MSHAEMVGDGRKAALQPPELLIEEEEPWTDELNGFEEILEVINPQGKFQKTFLYGFLCPLSVIYSLTSSFVYVFFIPKHWCHDPNWAQNYSTYEEWKNATIPKVIGRDGKLGYASCLMYSEGKEIPCQFGWEYDRSEMDVSMPSEFNWVCERREYVTIIFTVSGIAATLGTIILGPIIDKYGRKRIFVIFTTIDNIAAILRLFLPKYYELFLAFTIFTSFIGASAEIIVQELTDSEFRSWISATRFTVYVFGMAAVPAIVYLIRDWFYIALLAVLPRTLFLLACISFMYIPESPRWLISVGRNEEAKEIIKKVAKINGTLQNLDPHQLDLSLNRMSQNSNPSSDYTPFVGMMALLSRRRIARNAILLAISLAMNGFVYGGITLQTPYMPGNQFIAFFILAIIEIPSSMLGGYLMQRIGRRWTPAGFFAFSAVACFIAALHTDSPILVTVCIVISKFSVNLTCLVGIVQDVEIFPTQYRATGSSFTGMLSQTICLAMPAVVNMGHENASIPYYAFCLCSLIGISCSICLPETLHQSLPDTLDEANDFGKSQPFWSMRTRKGIPKKRGFIPVKNDLGRSCRGSRRESVVSFVSQVHPTQSIARSRRQSVINFVGL